MKLSITNIVKWQSKQYDFITLKGDPTEIIMSLKKEGIEIISHTSNTVVRKPINYEEAQKRRFIDKEFENLTGIYNLHNEIKKLEKKQIPLSGLEYDSVENEIATRKKKILDHFELLNSDTIRAFQESLFECIRDFHPVMVVSYLIGYLKLNSDSNEGHHSPDSPPPVFHYIENTLNHFGISPIEANALIRKYKGAFPAKWNNNIIPEIIEYINSLNNKTPQLQTEKPKTKQKEIEVSERIKKHFGFFNRNCPHKHKQILNDTDFGKLIKWTIWYFENNFDVPEISEPIKVVNTNKTFVQLAFKYLFKELHKSSPYPETLFEFYQSAFNPYSEDKKRNFEAVRNNDEVKKLMQIEC